ncbi:MAG: hypothetical protein AAB362_02920, partial [Patescibacteria group bacterium]
MSSLGRYENYYLHLFASSAKHGEILNARHGLLAESFAFDGESPRCFFTAPQELCLKHPLMPSSWHEPVRNEAVHSEPH